MLCAFCGKDFGDEDASFGRLVSHQRCKHFHYNSGYRKLMEIQLESGE